MRLEALISGIIYGLYRVIFNLSTIKPLKIMSKSILGTHLGR